jgi:SAM-dependent methyltransferase
MLNYRRSKRRVQDFLFDFEFGRRILRRGGPERPVAPWENSVLKRAEEWQGALEQVERLGLPVHLELTKNWDSLAALDCILRRTGNESRILDAGAERYSVILPWLCLYGYRDLYGINLVFESTTRRGPITYERGDVTQTRFDDGFFDAVTCLSVIEHGVDAEKYLKEMSRILKPGGVLITSVDYFETPVDTAGKTAYGVPVHVFSRDEIAGILAMAGCCGLSPTGPLDLRSEGKVVKWPGVGLEYTFLVFTLEKTAGTVP